MALTKAKVREILSAAGVDKEHMSDAVDSIIDGHLASINALREDVDKYKPDAEKLEAVQKELDELKAKGDGGLKAALDKKTAEYDKLKKESDEYKAQQTAKETRAAKETAVRAYLESKGIKGDNLTIALRGMNAEIDGAELNGEKLKDTAALDALISGTFKGLVSTVVTQGAQTATPPPVATTRQKMTNEQIYAKDQNGHYVMSALERQKAIAENLSQQNE